MKLLVITQNAPLYLPWFLDRFIEGARAAGHEVRLTRLSPLFRKTWGEEIRSRLACYGITGFAHLAARALWHKAAAALPAASRRGACHSLRNVIRKHGVEEWPAESVNAPDYVACIRSAGVDLVVSIAAPEIFRRPLLEAPARGCLNYHTALLPRHRGRLPLFWALWEGDAETGVTVHEMNERLDDGPILVQHRVPIEPGDTLDRLYWKTMRAGGPALLEAVEMIVRGDPRRLPNPREGATRHAFPDAVTARAFRRAGKRFF